MAELTHILISTPTSSATEHDSKVWIFKGFQFLILIGGIIGGISSMIFSIVVLHMKGIGALVFGSIPIICTFVYVIFFLLGKPPHYQIDMLEQLIFGSTFDYNPRVMGKLSPLANNEKEDV